MPPTLYTHQDECIDEMYATKKKVNLCKLFCGTGKTLIFTTYLVEKKYNLVVIAFPRIDLVNQYIEDYSHLASNYSRYVVSSDHESRSNVDGLKNFLRTSSSKMILVTHTSMWDVLDTIKNSAGVSIDCLILDEFHHFNTKRKLALIEAIPATRIFGFTATPTKSHPDPIYTYNYADALHDGRCKQFEIDLYNTEDSKTPEKIYKGLVYLAEKTGVKNVLCFHAFSNIGEKNGKTSVSTYKNLNPSLVVNKTSFKNGLRSHVITGNMKSLERATVLSRVAKAPADQLNIVHTCNTVSEGIDTKNIGSICFVDPKGSITSIIQAIGRCTRLDGTDNPARIFILNFGKSELDEHKTLLGVLNFLWQDCPELYKAAVENPNQLVAADYKFHFTNVIFNEKGGDMYKGKYIDDINLPSGTAAVECGNYLDGEIGIPELLDTKVDKWLYFYTNEETGEILDFIGESTTAPKKSKPKKYIKFSGLKKPPTSPVAVLNVDDILDEIWETGIIPEDLFTMHLTDEEYNTVADFFKTDNWDIVNQSMFNKYEGQIRDPNVTEIDYRWMRLDSIREMIESIKASNGELPSAFDDKGKLLSRVKAIKRGEEPGLPGLTKAEEAALLDQFGPDWWVPRVCSKTEKSKNLILSYFNNQNYLGLSELKNLQAGRKPIYPEVERLLLGLEHNWKTLKPSTLYDIYWNMENQIPYDDSMSISPGSVWNDTKSLGSLDVLNTTTTNARGMSTMVPHTPGIVPIPEEHDVMVTIFDFEDAIETGIPLESALKSEIKTLYREKNEFLMKFLDESGICGKKLLEYLR